MGSGIFLHDNFVTASMVTPSGQAAGSLTNTVKRGRGSAEAVPGGTPTALVEKNYYLIIDDLSGGDDVEQAKFRASDDGGATFFATGLTTSQDPVTLNNGVNVRFEPGSSPHFYYGDIFEFDLVVLYGVDQMLDLRRRTAFRSADVAGALNLVIDLGSAQEPKALILFDHNLSSAATITLEANTSDSWGSPPYQESVTWAADKILDLFSGATYQFWRVVISDASNPDGYIELGSLFLGDYAAPSRNFTSRYERASKRVGLKGEAYQELADTQKHAWRLLDSAQASDDLNVLKGVYDSLHDASSRRVLPVFFCPDLDDVADFSLYRWVRDWSQRHRFTTVFDARRIELVEVPSDE